MHSGKILRKVWFSVRRPAAAEKFSCFGLGNPCTSQVLPSFDVKPENRKWWVTTSLRKVHTCSNVSFCSEEVIGFDISRPSSKHKQQQIVALFFLDCDYEWSMSRQMMVMFEMATTRHSSNQDEIIFWMPSLVRSLWEAHGIIKLRTYHTSYGQPEVLSYHTSRLVLPIHFLLQNLEDEFRAISQPSFGYTFLSLKCFFQPSIPLLSSISNRPIFSRL